MRFKEFASSTVNASTIFSKVGTNKFYRQPTSMEIRTPHWEMREALFLVETTPEIFAGLTQITRFIIGNDIHAKSDDQKSQEFLDKWIKLRKNFAYEVEKLVFTAVGVGNAYVERSFNIDANGKHELDNIFTVPDPSRVFYNSQFTDKSNNYWIYELPREALSWRAYQPQIFIINYMYGSYYVRQTVYGCGLAENHMHHLKIGYSRDGWYGRGLINPGIDNLKILKEILNNIEKISKYRALNSKLITPSSDDMEIIEDDVEKIEQKLLNKRPEEHLVLNKALKIESLSNLNEYDTMGAELDYLRRSSGATLVPNFITPWPDTTYHNASEAKIPFQLQLDYLSNCVVEFLNSIVVDELRKTYPWLAEDLTIEFGKVSLVGYESKATYAANLWTQGVITLNEYRKTMDYDSVEGGNLFAWQMESKAETMLGDISKGGAKAKAQKPLSTNLQEQYFNVPVFNKRPRVKICDNCINYSKRKRWCKVNNWPVEGTDSCRRFEKKEVEEPDVEEEGTK